MKKLLVVLAMALPLMAADHKKHYQVCIHGGGDQACTKPLDKDTAGAVAEVLSKAPIGGLDFVSITDLNKVKDKKDKQPVAPAPQADPVHYDRSI